MDNVLTLTTQLSTDGIEKGFDAIKKGTLATAKAVNKTMEYIKNAVKNVISALAVKAVFEKFKQYLDTGMRKNKEFVASMKALRGSIAAAFQPIFETIGPGLTYLVQMLNIVVQAVGRFIAAISGKSYAQMLKNAEALSKQKDALDGVGDAAAGAQRQLMGFDEINKLSEDTGSGAGLSFGEIDLGSATGAIDDFAKKLRELILSGQFEEAGNLVAAAANKIINAFDLERIASRTAGWINNLTEFANALGFGINWDELGKKFADGVSTFLATLNGYNLGRTLSLKFAIAIKTLSGFMKNLKWQTVGQTLSDAILGFAQGLGKTISESLDSEFWETLNKNITDGFTAFAPGFIESLRIAVDTIAEQAPGVLQSIGNVGTQIVSLINGAFSAMDEDVVIGKLDQFDDRGFQLNRIGSRWEKLGYSLAEGFKKIDWETIFSVGIDSAGKLALGIVEFFKAGIQGVGSEKWAEIGKGIGTGLNKVQWSEILTSAVVDVEKIAIGLGELLTSAIENIDWYSVGSAIVQGISSIDWGELMFTFGDLLEALSYSLVELLTGMIDEAFNTHLTEIWKEFEEDNRGKGWGKYQSTETAPSYVISDDVSENIRTLASMVNDGATFSEINKMFINIMQAGGSLEELKRALSGIENQKAASNFYELYIKPLEDTETAADETTESIEDIGIQAESTSSTAGAAISTMADTSVTKLNEMRDAALNAGAAISWLSGLQLGPMGTSIRTGGTPSYQPMLENLVHCADGAIIPPNREFLAVFGDQRSGNNIETPEALMRQIVREESGDSGIQTLVEQMDELIRAVLGIRVGDDVIGRAAARYNRQHGRATGG